MNVQTKVEAAPPQVYAKIAAVQGELAKSGIGKDSENTFDRYKFRGIDAVYNALAPLLAKHGLCVLPRIIERDCQERVSKKGDPMFYVTVTAEFDFVADVDGSIHTVRTYGEAMDRSDKATNKAMSAAYKYAAFMAFAIPTEGDNDADASTLEVAAEQPKAKQRITWDGRYGCKTNLHKALTGFEREFYNLQEQGDLDQFEAFLTTDEYQDFIREAGEHMPHYLEGGEPAPPEFKGIFAIEQLTRDKLTAKQMADLAHT